MPYVTAIWRTDLDLGLTVPFTPGELNYKITRQIINYMSNHELSYQTINDVVGALENAKMEFYRRVAVPYEEQKRMENGDVYGS